MLHKVTTFILRLTPSGREILLFEHPFAGWQCPAGTVNLGETPETAAVREAAEETGLANLPIKANLGHRDHIFPPNRTALLAPTTVFSRPDPSSFDWVKLEPGILLEVHRKQNGYTQISYNEPDKLPNPTYNTYHILGWVPDEVLSQRQRRHFFLMEFAGSTPFSWKVYSDNHTFILSWFPMEELPELIPPQNAWLEILWQYLQNN